MDLFESELKQLTAAMEKNRPVLLFGAGFVGVNAHFYASKVDMNVAGFCDNGADKIGSVVCGLPVYSPKEAIEKFDNPVFVVCSSQAYEPIAAQLHQLGVTAIFPWLLPYYLYITQKTERPVNHEEFAQALYCKRENPSALFFPSIAYRVTQVCSLNCKNCFYFVPYDKYPVHYDKDFLLHSLYGFMDSVDAVEMMGLTGGEPFLHPDLGEILQGMAKCSNMLQINITTNGTILPRPEVLDIIAKNGIIIQISDYGALSSKLDELERACAERGILFLTSPMSLNWFAPRTTEHFSRSQDENKELYQSCTVRRYCDGLIEYGNFGLCAYVSRRARLDMIPRDSTCHVNLVDERIPTAERRARIEALVKKDVISYCDYCDRYENMVPAGEQAVGKTPYKKYYER